MEHPETPNRSKKDGAYGDGFEEFGEVLGLSSQSSSSSLPSLGLDSFYCTRVSLTSRIWEKRSFAIYVLESQTSKRAVTLATRQLSFALARDVQGIPGRRSQFSPSLFCCSEASTAGKGWSPTEQEKKHKRLKTRKHGVKRRKRQHKDKKNKS